MPKLKTYKVSKTFIGLKIKVFMQINVIIFGQIADITGTNSLTVDNAADTSQLVEHLTAAYPALCSAKYAIAVDKKIVKDNTVLINNNTIALLPPFSGG